MISIRKKQYVKDNVLACVYEEIFWENLINPHWMKTTKGVLMSSYNTRGRYGKKFYWNDSN